MRINDLYDFRLATVDDRAMVMDFLRDEWKPDHILVRDKEFFNYQHVVGDRVNAMLAIEKETGKMAGWEAFIQYSEKIMDIAPVMWKVASWVKTPFLGIEIVKNEKAQTNCRSYGGPGVNPKTALPLHDKILKHVVGRLKHFYILSERDIYKIAVVNKKEEAKEHPPQAQNRLVEFSNFKELESRFNFEYNMGRRPYKDGWYINKRYFCHPVYRYKVFGIERSGDAKIAGVLFAREIEGNGAKILRMVDFLGDEKSIAGIYDGLQERLTQENYEYIDFYCHGIESSILYSAGFVWKDDADPNIIPNYFEPFVQKNVDIWFAMSEDGYMFKGDGDQDRPS